MSQFFLILVVSMIPSIILSDSNFNGVSSGFEQVP